MTAPQRTYVSSSGYITTPPITTRVYNSLSDYASIAYLFVETLVTPIIGPRSAIPPDQRPRANSRGPSNADRGLGGAWGAGRGGGPSGGSGRGNGGGGGGFMSMGDLRGGRTVNQCGGGTCG